jgi:hypothetical protein
MADHDFNPGHDEPAAAQATPWQRRLPDDPATPRMPIRSPDSLVRWMAAMPCRVLDRHKDGHSRQLDGILQGWCSEGRLDEDFLRETNAWFGQSASEAMVLTARIRKSFINDPRLQVWRLGLECQLELVHESQGMHGPEPAGTDEALDTATVPASALMALAAMLNTLHSPTEDLQHSAALQCAEGDVPMADALLLRLQALAFLCHERRLSPWVTYDAQGQWDISPPAFMAAARVPLRIVAGRAGLDHVEFYEACVGHLAFD